MAAQRDSSGRFFNASKVKASIEGMSEMKRKFKKLAADLQGKALERAAMDGAFILQREIQQKANVFTDTGAYKGSIRAELEKASQTQATATVGTNAAQAFALEYGSGLHATGEGAVKAKYPIEPDTAPRLAWQGANGEWFGAMRVMHPGIEDQPHFRPGFEDGKDKAISAVSMSLKSTIDRSIT